jgi:methylmalonyl-CoA mutase cobalamin-binding domain/chain
MSDEVLGGIAEAMGRIDFAAVHRLVATAVDQSVAAERVVEALSIGLEMVGTRFEAKEYFLSELMMAGEIFRMAQEVLEPRMAAGDGTVRGHVVIGTVRGDLHDIGKNIVVTLLQTAGFQVTDLGVDTPPARFVDAVRRHRPDVLGLSALLRATVPEMGTVIQALAHAGLRDQVTVVVGGLPLNAEYAARIGADHYAASAWQGVETIKRIVKAR